MLHYALGDRLVRALTLASRDFFDNPPDAFSEVPIGRPMPVLVHARDNELQGLDELDAEISPFATLERLDAHQVHELCPLLKDDARHGIADRHGIRLDPHALLQGNLRALRSKRGEIVTGARVASVERNSGALAGSHRASRQFFRAGPCQCGRRVGRRGRGARRRAAAWLRAQTAHDRHLRRTPRHGDRRLALRQDGRRRALFRPGKRAVVRLADGRSAERTG